jgi:uncharacterized protein (DUF305 family)
VCETVERPSHLPTTWSDHCVRVELADRTMRPTAMRPGVCLLICFYALLSSVLCAATTQEDFNQACLDSTSSMSSSMPGMMMMGMDCDAPVPEGYETANATDFEKLFLRRMIIHHSSAIDMARLIPSRAQHNELLSLEQNITGSQSQELSQMTQWLQQWYAFSPPPANQTGMGAMMLADVQQLSTLRGLAFDLAFLDMMLPHHMGAINSSLAAQSRVAHTEVRTLAQNIIAAQQREVGLMQAWQTQWTSTPNSAAGVRSNPLAFLLLSSAACWILAQLFSS